MSSMRAKIKKLDGGRYQAWLVERPQYIGIGDDRQQALIGVVASLCRDLYELAADRADHFCAQVHRGGYAGRTPVMPHLKTDDLPYLLILAAFEHGFEAEDVEESAIDEKWPGFKYYPGKMKIEPAWCKPYWDAWFGPYHEPPSPDARSGYGFGDLSMLRRYHVHIVKLSSGYHIGVTTTLGVPMAPSAWADTLEEAKEKARALIRKYLPDVREDEYGLEKDRE